MDFKNNEQKSKDLMLWYKQPATKWIEALPLGNGHMGAMVFGGVNTEKIALSEITCYSGEASLNNNQKGASELIPSIREALFNHDYKKAELLSEAIIGKKLNTQSPFGNVMLDFKNESDEIIDYSRELQLNNGLSFIKYQSGDIIIFVKCLYQILIRLLR